MQAGRERLTQRRATPSKYEVILQLRPQNRISNPAFPDIHSSAIGGAIPVHVDPERNLNEYCVHRSCIATVTSVA
jgi:hypothetical protein